MVGSELTTATKLLLCRDTNVGVFAVVGNRHITSRGEILIEAASKQKNVRIPLCALQQVDGVRRDVTARFQRARYRRVLWRKR